MLFIGGLGGDRAAAPGGGHTGEGDRAAAGDLEEHGAVRRCPATARRGMRGGRLGRAWTGGAGDPGAAEGASRDVGDGDRERIGWDRGLTVPKDRGPGAAPGLPAAGPGVENHVCGG